MFKRIIIELHNKCNLKCEWCIRNLVDSTNEKIELKNLIFILNYIYKNIENFQTPLVFSLFRFDEPLLEKKMLYEVSSIIKNFFHKKNIKTFIYIHTNGILLNYEDFFNSLLYIDMIKINDYNNKGIVNILNDISKYPKIKIKEIIYNKNERDEIVCFINNKKVVFYVDSKNNLKIFSKGSSLKQDYIRHNKCDIVGDIFVVELNGDIMACCETNNKLHKDFIVGNIYLNNNIDLILNNIKKINTLSHEYCKNCEMNKNFCDTEHKEEAIIYAN